MFFIAVLQVIHVPQFGLGFMFSEDESTALVQQEGGPCAVLAPVQSFLLKNILFSNSHKKEDWRRIGGIVFS